MQINDLPAPPAGLHGWPWEMTAASTTGSTIPDDALPSFSIVVPSFNQGQYLEQTLRSLLLQGYPQLEIIVRDGGSTDDSVAIIERYAPWLTSWVSARDGGQANAINAGWAQATGDLIGWLNSDDMLLPGALFALARAHIAQPEAILLGDVEVFSDDGSFNQYSVQTDVTLAAMIQIWQTRMRWAQPGTFVPRATHLRVGTLDERLRYVFDRDWMIRLLRDAAVHYLGAPVARFRLHPGSKTVGEAVKWLPEHREVTRRYLHLLPDLTPSRADAAQLLWYGALPNLSIARLSVHRPRALAYIVGALATDWRVFGSRSFWLLTAMLATPTFVMRAVRPFIKL